MKGVKFFFDDKGRPKAVMIDLKKHGKIWEDFRDLMVIAKRRDEPRVSLEEVEARLRKRKRAS
jgi:hypothetical protein